MDLFDMSRRCELKVEISSAVARTKIVLDSPVFEGVFVADAESDVVHATERSHQLQKTG